MLDLILDQLVANSMRKAASEASNIAHSLSTAYMDRTKHMIEDMRRVAFSTPVFSLPHSDDARIPNREYVRYCGCWNGGTFGRSSGSIAIVSQLL